MSPTWIEIDDDVLAKIKVGAEPFTDSPNDALRNLLGLGRSTAGWMRGPGVPHGEGLPMAEYELPLLRAVSRSGGSAPRKKVIAMVGPMLADRLGEVDHGRQRNGEARWENRLAFARLRAVERGHIHSTSRRGIWELTDAGSERLGQLEAELSTQRTEAAG